MTAIGDTPAVHRVLTAGAVDSAQVCFNLLNPSAGTEVPSGFPGQDFDRLLDRARAQKIGVIVIRVLAAGALSGEATRHPIAVPTVEPIASGPDYATDVGRARALRVLVDEGHVGSLVEAALRFPLGFDAVSTVLLGYSSQAHLETAAAAIGKGRSRRTRWRAPTRAGESCRAVGDSMGFGADGRTRDGRPDGAIGGAGPASPAPMPMSASARQTSP
jgi:hypothetical protein